MDFAAACHFPWIIDDTVHGQGRGSIATIVDRKTGCVLIGMLAARTAVATNERLEKLMAKHPESFMTITADNGCEFHAYRDLEERTGAELYFANPYHSWERGTNENTNGLIRQYLPKGCCMEDLSPGPVLRDCEETERQTPETAWVPDTCGAL